MLIFDHDLDLLDYVVLCCCSSRIDRQSRPKSESMISRRTPIPISRRLLDVDFLFFFNCSIEHLKLDSIIL